MQLNKKLFTFRRGLALLLVVSMAVSLVQITTIGFADEHEGNSSVSVAQQLGATTVVSSDPGLIKANEAVRYTITAPIMITEEEGDAPTEETVTPQSDSLFALPIQHDEEPGVEEVFQERSTEGLPRTADADGASGITVTAIITADLPEKFVLSENQLNITCLDDEGNSIAITPDNQSTEETINIRVENIDRNCTLLVDVMGNAASDVAPGDVLVFQANLQVDSAQPQQSNVVRATAPLSHTMAAKVSVSGTPTYTVKANDFSFDVTRTVNGANAQTTTVTNDAAGNITLFTEEYTEEGTYIYSVHQKATAASGTAAINRDTAQYVVTVPVIAAATGTLSIGTVTVTKDGAAYTGDIVFENTVTQATLDSAKVQLSGVVSTIATLKGGEYTFTITPVRVDYSGVPAAASVEDDLLNAAPVQEDIDDVVSTPEVAQPENFVPKFELLGDDFGQDEATPGESADEGIADPDTEDTTEEVTVTDDEIPEESVEDTEGFTSEDTEVSTSEDTDVESSEEDGVENEPVSQNDEDADSDEAVAPEEDTEDLGEGEPVPNATGSLTTPPSPTRLTTTNNADGTFSFGEVTFTEPALYVYEVRQSGSGSGLDTSVFQIQVNVQESSTALVPSVTYTKNGTPASSINFVNTTNTANTNTPKMTMRSYQAVQNGSTTQDQITVSGGTVITYTMDIVNEGTADASNVIITAPIPSGLTFVENSQTAGGEVRNNTITWYAQRSIAAGQRVSVTFKVTVPNTTAANRWTFSPYLTYTNNPDNNGSTLAQVAGGSLVAVGNTSSGGNNNGSSNNTGLSLTLTQSRNRESAGTTTITAYSGDTIHYSVNVTNLNSAAVDNISITDYVPDGVSVLTNTISSNGTLRSGNVLWTLNRLEAGATLTFSFDVEVDNVRSSTTIQNSIQAYAQTNTSQVSYSNTVSAILYPETDVDDFAIDIEQSLTTSRNATDQELAVKAGDTVTYFISVSNLSRTSSGKLTVTCDIPSGMSVVSRSVSDDGYVSRNTVSWELDAIAGRSSEELSFSVTVPNSGTYWDCFAELEFDSSSSVLKSNTVRASTTGTTTGSNNNNGVSLVLTQALNGGSAQSATISAGSGDTITYTLVLTNTSTSQLTNVVISDVVPSGLTIVANTANGGGVVTGNTVTWNLGTMPVNSRYTVSFNATVNQATVGTTWTNSGTATYRAGNNSQSVQSNALSINYSGTGTNDTNQGTNGTNTGTMGQPIDGTGTNGTLGTNGTNGTNSSLSPDQDPNNYPEVFDKDKIPQTGGFTELHLWMFLFVVSGLGLMLMGITSKKAKYKW